MMSPDSANDSRRIVIVGGGVSGLSIAVRLSQSGLPVTLLEASDLAQAASTRNQGWLYSGGWFAPKQRNLAIFCYESLQQTLSFCPECLEPDTARMIYVFTSDKTNHSEWVAAWASSGIPHETVGAGVVSEETGLPAAMIERAYRLPDRAIRPEVLIKRLIAQAEYQGVELRTRTPVASLLTSANQVHGVMTSRHETIEASLVILAANASGASLWPTEPSNAEPHGRTLSIKGAPQTEFTRVALKAHCLSVQPGLSRTPYCLVDLEGLSHLPHAASSVFGSSRWLPVSDGCDSRSIPSEVNRLRTIVTKIYPKMSTEPHELVGWAGTTVQAMHVDQVEPGLAPMPTVIDHSLEPPCVANLISVFPGRASLWPQLAEATRIAVLEKRGETFPEAAKAPWSVQLPHPHFSSVDPRASILERSMS